MQRVSWLMALALVAGASAKIDGALAQGAGDVFDRIDRNGDGVISEEEFRNWMAATYGRKDADGNRILTWAELHPDGRPQPADWVDFSLDDVMAAIPVAFAQRDRDGDGKLSREEMAAAPPGALVEEAAEAGAKAADAAADKPKE
jgi:Ca2+-binding EF-hand superfamily protein